MITDKNLEPITECPYCKVSSFDNDFIQLYVTDVGGYELMTYGCLNCVGDWDEIRRDGEFIIWIPNK